MADSGPCCRPYLPLAGSDRAVDGGCTYHQSLAAGARNGSLWGGCTSDPRGYATAGQGLGNDLAAGHSLCSSGGMCDLADLPDSAILLALWCPHLWLGGWRSVELPDCHACV